VLRRVSNPPNPWSSTHVEWIGEPPPLRLEVYEEDARSILSENQSPDLPFRFSVNPYRGCTHACAYCYARPTHEFLEWGAGTDFDRKIVVKRNAHELLERELPKVAGETLAFSGVTDCYQALESRYEITRRCLELCVRFRQPIGIVTKGALVQRDIDLLQRLPDVSVCLSVPFLDDDAGRALEPWVAAPSQRFVAMRALSDAGIETGLAIAPLIPGLNDSSVPELLERARDNGAKFAFLTMLRLPKSVLPVFEDRLARTCPEHASRVFSSIREVRDGKLDESAMHARMRGTGARWEIVETLFAKTCARLGLEVNPVTRVPRRPKAEQRGLFEGR